MRTIRVVIDFTLTDLNEANRQNLASMSGMGVDELENVNDLDPDQFGRTIATFITRSTNEALYGSDVMAEITDAVYVSAQDTGHSMSGYTQTGFDQY